MTPEDAQLLAEFIKAHDKRFEAKAKTEAPGDRFVLLTRISDGTTLDPVTSIDQYCEPSITSEERHTVRHPDMTKSPARKGGALLMPYQRAFGPKSAL
jgi:hypothetical protein